MTDVLLAAASKEMMTDVTWAVVVLAGGGSGGDAVDPFSQGPFKLLLSYLILT